MKRILFGTTTALVIGAVGLLLTTDSRHEVKPDSPMPAAMGGSATIAATALLAAAPIRPPTAAVGTTTCTMPTKIADIASSSDWSLRRLGALQETAGAFVADQVSFFFPYPATADQGKILARDLVRRLKNMRERGISPVIFLEPTLIGGATIPLKDIKAGSYRVALDAMFENMKKEGLAEDSLGLWMPYPEINTPAWKREGFRESDFAAMMNDFSLVIRRHYPNARVGILLDTYSYRLTESEWRNGRKASWLPYVRGIRKGAVQVVGVQGFPWYPPRNSGPYNLPLDNPSAFIGLVLAREAGKAIQVPELLIHTGSAARMHTQNYAQEVVVSRPARKTMLDEIAALAIAEKSRWKTVGVSIFTEDKSQTPERKDWSFKKEDGPLVSAFAARLHCAQIELTIF